MIVDAHCHVAKEGAKLQSVDKLLRHMDEARVDKAILCPSDREIAVLNDAGNRRIAGIVRVHPDRFLGMVTANPWFGGEALETMRRGREEGLCGLKLHPPLQGFQLSSELVDPLANLCGEYGWPVYCHTGTPVCSEPLQLTELARRHPNVSFIMGHMGWSDFACDTINAARMSDNITLETSHMIGGGIQEAVERVGAHRVLFGSDAPMSSLRAELDKFTPLEFSAEDRTKVLSATALNLFGAAT